MQKDTVLIGFYAVAMTVLAIVQTSQANTYEVKAAYLEGKLEQYEPKENQNENTQRTD